MQMIVAEMGNPSCRSCAEACFQCMGHSGVPAAASLHLHLNAMLLRHGAASCLGVRHVLRNAATSACGTAELTPSSGLGE